MRNENYSHKRLYRSRNGVIGGICRGIADYVGVNVFWVRVATALAFLAFFPIIIAYVIAVICMPLEPVMVPVTDEDKEFYSSFSSSRTMALARLKRKFEQLERRTRRIESLVTAREYAWEHRLRSGQ